MARACSTLAIQGPQNGAVLKPRAPISKPPDSNHEDSIQEFVCCDPTAVIASLSPAPVCNAIQESALISSAPEFDPSDLEYPMSSPEEIELTGDLDFVPASPPD